MGLAALGGYVFVFFPLMFGALVLLRSSSLPPVLLAWAPIALLAIDRGAALFVDLRACRFRRCFRRQLPSTLEHRLHQPAERLSGDGVGQRQALEIVEIRVGDVGTRIRLLDPFGDRGERVGGPARPSQRGLQSLDFGHIRHTSHFIAVTGSVRFPTEL